MDENGNHLEVIPQTNIERMKIIASNIHSAHHVCLDKMEGLAKKQYFKIPREILRDVISKCVPCSQSQPLKRTDPFVNIRAKSPNERFQIDLVDLRKFSAQNKGYSWLMVVVDVYSKFCFVRKLKTKSAQDVANGFKKLCLWYGPPTILQSDNGLEFKNEKLTLSAMSLKLLDILADPETQKQTVKSSG